jgi:hypothetical protein
VVWKKEGKKGRRKKKKRLLRGMLELSGELARRFSS